MAPDLIFVFVFSISLHSRFHLFISLVIHGSLVAARGIGGTSWAERSNRNSQIHAVELESVESHTAGRVVASTLHQMPMQLLCSLLALTRQSNKQTEIVKF